MNKILIVDDKEDNIISLEFLLKQLPGEYSILTAIDGFEALTIVTRDLPDIILLDINMPRMDGYEVCSRIRENKTLPYTPILFVTAYALDVNSRIKAYESGADDFIGKPFIKEDLFARINSALRIKSLNDELRKERDSLEERVAERTRELLQKEEALNASLEEKNILLKEIHHRVKNNLQVITSLLNLEADKIVDPKDKEVFDMVQQRIYSIALVHEKLYQSDDYAKINMQEYINSFIDELIAGYRLPENISIKKDIAPIQLNLNAAIPCALIINELICNAIKHAFHEPRQGSIRVEFHQPHDTNTLMVSDDGSGLSDDKNNDDTNYAGLNIVHALVNQLKGTIAIDTSHGTRFTISFSLIKD
ncbi:MAG: response regulator [bacterium]|nr:response regulator [bacterium]